jgi:uncharacterized protein
MTCDRQTSGLSALPKADVDTETGAMDNRGKAPEPLTRAQCFDLLRTTGIARIAYSQRAMPAIATVDYAVIDEGLVLRVSEGSAELASMRDAVLAFQADSGGPVDQHPWSVTCVGKARPVENAAEALALAAAPEWSSEGSARPAFLRMEPDLLEGRLFHDLPIARGGRLSPAAAPAS